MSKNTSDPPQVEQDWSNTKGIADEPNIRRFVKKVGGTLIDEAYPNPLFENADFLFEESKVLVELKILETEFGRTDEFEKKLLALGMKTALKFGLGPFLRLEGEAGRAHQEGLVELFRRPLARIAKKANKQVKSTKEALDLQEYKGLLWCVNDSFRELNPAAVAGLLGRILTGSGSSIDGFIYLTNHYIELPGDPYARLLWAPFYRDSDDEKLREFVNWLGRKWFDYCEAIEGVADDRIEGDELSIDGARVVRSPYRHYRYD